MQKRYDENSNKQELIAIVEEMASLDERYPKLSTPSKVREMITNSNFSIDHRPWDFLIALGYSMIGLSKEKDEENSRAINSLQKRVDRALRHPMKWMYDAITADVQERYLKVAARNLPEAVITKRPKRRVPQSLKGECQDFAWHEYAQLLYVLRRFCSCPYVVGLPVLDDKYWWLLSVREMRDLVASMERPPQEILQELNQEAAVIELESLQKDLYRAQGSANSLALLGYIATPDSVELKALKSITRALNANTQND